MVVDMFELYNIVSWETKRMITMAKESWAADDILWSRFNLGMMIAEEEFKIGMMERSTSVFIFVVPN